jgi:hypothetical protein
MAIYRCITCRSVNGFHEGNCPDRATVLRTEQDSMSRPAPDLCAYLGRSGQWCMARGEVTYLIHKGDSGVQDVTSTACRAHAGALLLNLMRVDGKRGDALDTIVSECWPTWKYMSERFEEHS